jgi:hypothetical protein
MADALKNYNTPEASMDTESVDTIVNWLNLQVSRYVTSLFSLSQREIVRDLVFPRPQLGEEMKEMVIFNPLAH